MQTHKATRISIIVERMIEDGVISILEEFKATGYSIYKGSGKGEHGDHPTHRPSIVDDFAIVKIEVIISDPQKVQDITEQIHNRFFDYNPGVIYLHEVDVLRPQKF